MATTAAEQSKTRSDLAQLAGAGPLSLISIVAGVLVALATFSLLLGGTLALLHHRESKIDFPDGWGNLSTRGGLLLGGLLFVSYLLAGYMAGRMAWRRGIVHGIGVVVGSFVVVGAVAMVLRSFTKAEDVEPLTDALRSLGVPTTLNEWGDIGPVVGLASLGGMLAGSVLGGLVGERWFTRVSRKAQRAEVDVRERLAATNGRGRRAVDSDSFDDSADVDVEDLTKEELYQLAQEEDIPGRSQMNKEELKQALQNQN